MAKRFESYYSDECFDFEFEGKDYRIELEATAEEYHEPGCMYHANGDPGDPPEDEFELKSVDATWYLITDEDGNELEVTPTKEMTGALEDWLKGHSELFGTPEAGYDEES